MAYSRTQYTYNGLVINDQTTDTTQFVLMDSDAIADTVVDNVEDILPTDPGIVDYGSKLGKGLFAFPLQLFATTEAKMRALSQEVKAAFNPDLAEADATYGESTDYGGYLPFTWTETQDATEIDFRMWLKPVETPRIQIDSLSGLIIPTKVTLKARDPRKYSQTQSTRAGAGAAVNNGDYPTNVVITLTATGTTPTTLSINNTTTGKSIYITTALANGEVLTIDTRLHSAKLGSTETRSYIGSSSTWWTLQPGSNTITLTDATNVTASFAWYDAWTI